MEFGFDERTAELHERLTDFMADTVHPAEPVFAAQVAELAERGERWRRPPVVEELKNAARQAGLWNLFLPDERFGAGLTNLQYAPLAELTGHSPQDRKSVV